MFCLRGRSSPLFLMGLLDPYRRGKKERKKGGGIPTPTLKRASYVFSRRRATKKMSGPPARPGPRKRIRMAERSIERGFDIDDRTLEDARSIREVLVLWTGAARLLVHLNRGHYNMAAMTLQSKKIIATATSYVVGLERDLKLMGWTPKEILGQANLQDLKAYLWPKIKTKDYQEFVRNVQIRPTRPDPITRRYATGSSHGRSPGWEDELVALAVNMAEMLETTVTWAIKSLWSQSRETLIAEDSRAMFLFRRLSITETDIKGLGVLAAFMGPWVPADAHYLEEDVYPENSELPATSGMMSVVRRPGGASGASSASYTHTHTQNATPGQTKKKAPAKAKVMKMSEYKQRCEKSVKSHESRLTELENTVSNAVDHLVKQVNDAKDRWTNLNTAVQAMQTTLQQMQINRTTYRESMNRELKEIKETCALNDEKQSSEHNKARTAVKRLEDGGTQVQRRLRNDVNINRRRLDTMEGKKEPPPIYIPEQPIYVHDTELGDAGVAEIKKIKNDFHKKRTQIAKEQAAAAAAEPDEFLEMLEEAEREMGIDPAPEPAPDAPVQSEEEEGEYHEYSAADVAPEAPPPVEDEDEDHDDEPARAGTYSPSPESDPLDGTPNEPEPEAQTSVASAVLNSLSQLRN